MHDSDQFDPKKHSIIFNGIEIMPSTEEECTVEYDAKLDSSGKMMPKPTIKNKASIKIQEGKFYQTRCGFKAKIYSISPHNVNGFIHGAVFIPPHPASFPGWTTLEWELNGTSQGGPKDGSWDIVKVWLD
jgi:hypothetical protein